MILGKGKHYLTRLAADYGIQKQRQGRELVPLLRECPYIDGPHQLPNGVWYIQLLRREAQGRGEEQAQEAGQEEGSQGIKGEGEARNQYEKMRNQDEEMSNQDERLSAVLRSGLTIEVVHRSPGLAVLSKPSGISTENLIEHIRATGALAAGEGEEGGYKIQSVSRLDQPTSGAIVVPTTAECEAYLTHLFKSREVDKTYICLVRGETPREGRIDAKLLVVENSFTYKVEVHYRGKEAVTEYRRIGLFELPAGVEGVSEACREQCYSLLEVKPISGRTHQIRKHMQHSGYPLVSDARYNSTNRSRRQQAWCPRLFLHAQRLQFIGLDGQAVDVTVPLSDDLSGVISRMRRVPETPSQS